MVGAGFKFFLSFVFALGSISSTFARPQVPPLEPGVAGQVILGFARNSKIQAVYEIGEDKHLVSYFQHSYKSMTREAFFEIDEKSLEMTPWEPQVNEISIDPKWVPLADLRGAYGAEVKKLEKKEIWLWWLTPVFLTAGLLTKNEAVASFVAQHFTTAVSIIRDSLIGIGAVSFLAAIAQYETRKLSYLHIEYLAEKVLSKELDLALIQSVKTGTPIYIKLDDLLDAINVDQQRFSFIGKGTTWFSRQMKPLILRVFKKLHEEHRCENIVRMNAERQALSASEVTAQVEHLQNAS